MADGPAHPNLGYIENFGQQSQIRQDPPAPRSDVVGKMHGMGLRVMLRRIPHLTDKGVLHNPFYFQCPPRDTFRVAYAYDHQEYVTVRHGQLSRPVGRNLATISFDTLFIDANYAWTNLRGGRFANETSGKSPTTGLAGGRPILQGGVPVTETERHLSERAPNPKLMVKELHALLVTGTPFELVIGQPRLWGTNDVHWGPVNGNAATLRTLDVEERAGELDSRYVSVAFTEYRSAQLIQKKKGPKTKSVSHDQLLPLTVVVTRDGVVKSPSGRVYLRNATLHKLAKYFYGSYGQWHRITVRGHKINWPPSRSLGEYVHKQKAKSMKFFLPEPSNPEPHGEGPGLVLGEGPGLPSWFTED